MHIRRNHALEHATIHLLSARHPHLSLVGRSDTAGFYLFGNVPTELVDEAVHEALSRFARVSTDWPSIRSAGRIC